MSHPLLIGAIGAVSLVLTVVAYRAYSRSQDKRLLCLVAAFLTMTAKQALTAYAITTTRGQELLPHETLETVDSALDLVVVLLLVAPLFLRGRSAANGAPPPPPKA